MGRRSATAAWLLVVAGCGSEPTPIETDAGPPVSSIAAAPVLTPCPAGWREIVEGGIAVCEPWPETGRVAECGTDGMHVPGSTGCARVGPACPSDGWPGDLPPGRTLVHVDARAAAGGDGATRATALRSVADAVARAPVGAIVVIASGRYDVGAGVTVGRAIEIRGACVAESVLTSTATSDDLPVIALAADGAALRALAIDAPERMAIDARAPVTRIDEVVVRGARGVGVRVSSGRLEARRLAVRATRARASDPRSGTGIEIHAGASLAVSAGVVDGTVLAGVFAQPGVASVELSDISITGAATLGAAAIAAFGGDLRLTRVVIEDTTGSALSGSIIGPDLVAEDLVVRDIVPDADGDGGHGISLGPGGTVRLSRVRIERVRSFGLYATGSDAAVDVGDLLVRDVAPPGLGHYAGCVWVQSLTSVVLRRAALERCGFAGVVGVADADVALEDTAIRGVVPASCADTTCADRAGGHGIISSGRSRVTATRVEVIDAATCGVVVGGLSDLDLHVGAIDRSAIGACVQIDGYDITRLMDDVEYRDNGVPLRATSYVLPDPLAM